MRTAALPSALLGAVLALAPATALAAERSPHRYVDSFPLGGGVLAVAGESLVFSEGSAFQLSVYFPGDPCRIRASFTDTTLTGGDGRSYRITGQHVLFPTDPCHQGQLSRSVSGVFHLRPATPAVPGNPTAPPDPLRVDYTAEVVVDEQTGEERYDLTEVSVQEPVT